MTLYEIDAKLNEMLSQIDPETGELLCSFEELDQLSMERDTKIENIALFIKNLRAEGAAIKAEEENLAKRRKSAENKAASLERYLYTHLNGQGFKTPRTAITWRSSEAVELDETFIAWAKVNRDDLLNYGEPKANKTLIKSLLKQGDTVPGAALVKRNNMTIK